MERKFVVRFDMISGKNYLLEGVSQETTEKVLDMLDELRSRPMYIEVEHMGGNLSIVTNQIEAIYIRQLTEKEIKLHNKD